MSNRFGWNPRSFRRTMRTQESNRTSWMAGFEKLEPRQLLATMSIQSGPWHDVSTWSDGIPDASTRAIVSSGTNVTLDGINHHADEIVVHGVLDVAEGFSNTPKSLNAEWIHVNSGGVFQIGTVANRFDEQPFVLTLSGSDITADHSVETTTGTMEIQDNDGFLMTASGGRIQFFGEVKTAFTKLAETAEPGALSISVENIIERNFDGSTSAASDGRVNWKVGDQIVVSSSSYEYSEQEVRTIVAVADTGVRSLLTLDSALQFRHYGEIESYSNDSRTWDIDLRAEVSVLNRSITIQGLQDTDDQFGDRANFGTEEGQNLGIGAHLMVMPGSGQISIDGVRFEKMGQTAQLGRYPVHWHLAGNRTGDILANSSVTNSNNRGVTVHGTQGVLIRDNVLHDIHGHGFFMEDAAETGNQFLHNITFGIHAIGGGSSHVLTSNDPFVVPGITRGPDGNVNGQAFQNENGKSSHDTGQNLTYRFRHSAAFWITNPDNTWVGNINAGSEGSGFWFALPKRVLGLSFDTGLYNGINPLSTNLQQFDHNTSHSSPVGLTFDRGGDILPGPTSNNYEPSVAMQVNHYTGYKHIGTAVYHRANEAIFNESRFADNFTSSFNTFLQEEHNILFVGHSRGNADKSELVGGYRLYDGPGLIANSHFAGFTEPNAHTFVVEGGANKHSMTRASGISFENDGTEDHLSVYPTNQSVYSVNNSPEFVAGRPDGFSGVVLDVDGSLTSHGGGGAGFVLTPKINYFLDDTDLAPVGWNSFISDDRFAQFKIGVIGDDNIAQHHIGGVQGDYIPEFRITNGSGGEFLANRWNNSYVQRFYTKLNAGDYTIEFTHQMPIDGFDVMLQIREAGQAGDATVFRFVDAGRYFEPETGTEKFSIFSLRAANQTAYFRDLSGDLWMKIFPAGNDTSSAVNIAINPVTTLEVTNGMDSGTGSLRDAITRANDRPGLDLITFDIPGTADFETVTPISQLPTISDRLIIDGSTQSRIALPDSGFEFPLQPDHAFKLASGGGMGTLKGSAWFMTGRAGITRNLSGFQQNFPAPVGKQHALIQNIGGFHQFVGGFEVGQEYNLSLLTMARQYGSFGNNLKVILDTGMPFQTELINIPEVTFDEFTEVTSTNFTATQDTYLLSIIVDRNNNTLTGDRTTFFDDVEFHRIVKQTTPNSIIIDGANVKDADGLTIDQASLVHGITINNFNNGAGFRLTGSGIVLDRVWSGVNHTGAHAIPNWVGVHSQGNSNTVRYSLISGNRQHGLVVDDAANNVVFGNWIGTDAAGALALSNGASGISVHSSFSSSVFFNHIAFNSENGVSVYGKSSIENAIRINSIHSNGQLAIDLGDDGATANDELDTDIGPNQLSNHPVLFSAKVGGISNATIKGGMVGLPNTNYAIDFYWSESAKKGDVLQGKYFATTATVTTNSFGRAKFSVKSSILLGHYVTAMATDSFGNSSEYAMAVPVTKAEPLSRSNSVIGSEWSVNMNEIPPPIDQRKLAADDQFNRTKPAKLLTLARPRSYAESNEYIDPDSVKIDSGRPADILTEVKIVDEAFAESLIDSDSFHIFD